MHGRSGTPVFSCACAFL
jgi:hypothetical protein